MKPIRIFFSELGGRFYATRAWKITKSTDSSQVVEITGQKFDVTDEIASLIERHQITFTVAGESTQPKGKKR